jgi:DNA-binding winged helix-turn-helix (wHTH) protein
MTAIYAFGQYRLDVAAGILFRGAEPVALGRRAVALLQVLVEGAGNPISKDRLIESAWPGLAIEESNLAVQISALRRVFAEEPGGDGWIETLPRRGYRYAGPVAVKEQGNQGATGDEQCSRACAV